jgi:small subunit ribosomal protein S9
MADESQSPEGAEPQAAQPQESEGAAETQAQAPQEAQEQAPAVPDAERSPAEAEALAEHHAVPTGEAAEIAGSAEDAALEAFEEARDEGAQEAQAQPPAGEGAQVTDEVPAALAGVEAADRAAAAASGKSAAASEAPAGPGEDVPASTAAAEAPAGETEDDEEEYEEEEPAPRVKPAVPGAHLEVDIVPEGVDPLGRDVDVDPYAIEEDEEGASGEQEVEEDRALPQPISTAAIDLAAGARYRATGKRKTAIARVTLRPGAGSYTINGRPLDAYFPRSTLQRNIRQPLETVGYEERMDVIARLHGGGISAQAGALRHGISRALLEADPNLRGELKRRGFLTRDSRAKERKKAGLKKARKRPQFSKR